MKKYLSVFAIIFLIAEAKSQVTQFLDYYPLAVGNSFVYIDQEVSPPTVSTFKIYIPKDTVAYNHRYYKLMRSDTYTGGYLFGWFRYDSTNGNLLAFYPGNGCQPYANDKIVDSLVSRKGDHCNGCVYIAISGRTCTDTINGTYFNISVKTKSYNHSGAVTEYLTYAKGFGKVYYYGGEPGINYYMTMKGCRVNGIIYGDTILTSIKQISSKIPESYTLFQNYPNPFNPSTKIKFSMPVRGLSSPNAPVGDLVTLKVYNILGKEIATLVNEKQSPGEYEVPFSINQFSGYQLPSGIYFYTLRAGDYAETKKMILIK
jgi:hypothetical protein